MAYRDSTTASGNSATPSVAVPTGVAADDIVILAATIDSSAASFATVDFPTGFTRFVDDTVTGDGHSFGIGWKRLTGADAGSYTFGDVGGTADWVCQAIAFSGRHTTNAPVIGTSNLDSTLSNTPQTPAANAVTYVEGDDVVWLCGPDYDTSTGFTAWDTVPTNFTSRENTENAWSTLLMASRDNAPAGDSGSISGQFSHAFMAGWGCWQVRIPLAAAGGGGATARFLSLLGVGK